ncbi:MAG: DUF1501 domain-containing protein, partial [Planctomycetaceae bacterium]|nr:DUF1501 domain-containing protein [Planctomycetaceae bacterium]
MMFSRFNQRLDRRSMLSLASCGFGSVALAALLHGESQAADSSAGVKGRPEPHHAPRAKRVIFLYMDGGPSQVDTFDPKPRLRQD